MGRLTEMRISLQTNLNWLLEKWKGILTMKIMTIYVHIDSTDFCRVLHQTDMLSLLLRSCYYYHQPFCRWAKIFFNPIDTLGHFVCSHASFCTICPEGGLSLYAHKTFASFFPLSVLRSLHHPSSIHQPKMHDVTMWKYVFLSV